MSRRRQETWAFLAACLVLTLVYTTWWSHAPVVSSDTADYLAVARDLADGRLSELPSRSIGYPLLLLLTGSTAAPTRALFVASLLLHFAVVVSLTSALAKLGLSLRSRSLFFLIASLPPLVQPAAFALTENLTQFLIVSSYALLLLWSRSRRCLPLAFSGLLLGAAALVRPAFQLAAFAVLPLILLAAQDGGRARFLRRGVTAGGVYFIAFAVLVVGASIGNSVSFGFFGLAPGHLPYSLSTKTVRILERLPDAYAAEREVLIRERDRQLLEPHSSHTAEQYYDQAKPQLAEVTGLSGIDLDRHSLRLQLRLIRDSPLIYLWESARAVPSFWFPTANPRVLGGGAMAHAVWAGAQLILVLAFILQAVIVLGTGTIALGRRLLTRPGGGWQDGLDVEPRRVFAYLAALSLILYTMLISCGVHHGEARFRAPVDLLVLLLCFLGSMIIRGWITDQPADHAESPRERSP